MLLNFQMRVYIYDLLFILNLGAENMVDIIIWMY